MKIILQKFIAQTGYSSRRKAEELIRTGKVTVDGIVAKVGESFEEKDLNSKLEVRINGKTLNLPDKKIYIILNKPVGYVCTTRRFKGEKNIFELIETPEKNSLIIAGRLDKDSRGLLLLTNDGEVVYRLTHPKFRHEKKYTVDIKTNQKQTDLDYILKSFRQGIDIGEGDGVVRAKAIKCLNPQTGADLKFEIVLTQGKKRQIRRMFKKIGFKVINLMRTEIAGIELSNLPEGKWRELNEFEIKKLLDKK
jgi:23S rRNA pseudouridine2605 synthase